MAGNQEISGNERQSKSASEASKEAHPKSVRFIVVIRGRNCAKYALKCLKSLTRQVYPHWQAMVVLDEPTDNSKQIINDYRQIDRRVFLYVNDKRRGLCGNMYFAIRWANCILKPDNDTVFAILDADDWLSKTAFLRVERVYRKHPKTLITHGSYIKLSRRRKTKISRPYPKRGDVRKLPWRGSHLKTFKWAVGKHIDEKWFKHKGKWLDAASDLALMFGLIEKAGLKRVRHVPQGIYYWRDNTPSKTGRSAQRRCERILRAK